MPCTYVLIIGKLSQDLFFFFFFFKLTCRAAHFTNIFPLLQNPQEFTDDERGIARHFTVDTLPGLMHRGLTWSIERHQTGTLLLVAGNLWKERSRFFKESLLAEVLIYNKVNGYAVETLVADHSSKRLYAKVLSSEKKEVFD